MEFTENDVFIMSEILGLIENQNSTDDEYWNEFYKDAEKLYEKIQKHFEAQTLLNQIHNKYDKSK